MTCFHPIPGMQEGPGGRVVLYPPLGSATLSLPCGSCIGCRTAKASMWARRCEHEASLWENNSFLTLTYDDEHLPPEGHLCAQDLQLFLKRLRADMVYHPGLYSWNARSGFRFFACGEYGERNGRPHFHVLLFNLGFTGVYSVGKALVASNAVADVWGFGEHRIGAVTPRSACYVAQYNVKKQGGAPCDEDGVYRPAPFLRMSNRPGIGAGWLDRFKFDLQSGVCVSGDGSTGPVPRYYRRVLARDDPEYAEELTNVVYERQREVGGDPVEAASRLPAGEAIMASRKALFARRSL